MVKIWLTICIDTVELPFRRKEAGMKWHRFFAMAACVCMGLCVYTGKKHK